MLEKMQEYLKNMQKQAADAKSTDTVEDMKDVVKDVADSLNQIHAIFVNTAQYALETADNVFDLTNKVAMLTNQAYSQRERCINALDSINRILSKKFDNDAALKQQVQQTRILRKLMQKKEFEIKNDRKERAKQQAAARANATATTKMLSSKKKEPAANPAKPGTQGIDSKLIADKLTTGLCKTLNPIALVSAFFTKLLPLLIIAGLLLYGFVVGFMGGTFWDFVVVLGATIVGLFVAFVAFQIAKTLILLGIQIACEWIKVALAAQPAALAMIAVGVIVLAFLAVAAVIAVAVVGAIIAVIAATYLITKAMKAMVNSMIESIMGTFAAQLAKTEDMIKLTMQTLSEVIPMMANKMLEMSNTLNDGLNNVINNLHESFLRMEQTMDGLASEMSKIFNGLAAAIISSALFKSVEKARAEGEDLTARLSPIHETLQNIEKAVAAIAKDHVVQQTKIARSTYNGGSTYNQYGGNVNTVQPLDGTKVLSDTAVLGTPEDRVTQSSLVEMQTALIGKMNELIAAIGKMPQPVIKPESDRPFSIFG